MWPASSAVLSTQRLESAGRALSRWRICVFARMTASGVFSSCDASDTKRRCWSQARWTGASAQSASFHEMPNRTRIPTAMISTSRTRVLWNVSSTAVVSTIAMRVVPELVVADFHDTWYSGRLPWFADASSTCSTTFSSTGPFMLTLSSLDSRTTPLCDISTVSASMLERCLVPASLFRAAPMTGTASVDPSRLRSRASLMRPCWLT